TGKIRVPTRADTSGEASRRWRTRISTSSAMASPPLLLAPGLRGRLENGLAEHISSVLHGPGANGVQRRPQPGAGRHLVGAGFMEVQVEAPVGGSDGERRSVGPPLPVDPPDGPVGVPPPRAARAARVARCPAPGFFTDALGR